MDTRAPADGFDTEADLQTHLAELEAEAPAENGIPIPLNEEELARQSRLQLLKDELSEIQFRLGSVKADILKAQDRATSVVKYGTRWADASAHAQLGNYPWAKLAGAAIGTFVGTRLLRMLPLGGLSSIAVPMVLSQLKQRNLRSR